MKIINQAATMRHNERMNEMLKWKKVRETTVIKQGPNLRDAPPRQEKFIGDVVEIEEEYGTSRNFRLRSTEVLPLNTPIEGGVYAKVMESGTRGDTRWFFQENMDGQETN